MIYTKYIIAFAIAMSIFFGITFVLFTSLLAFSLSPKCRGKLSFCIGRRT